MKAKEAPEKIYIALDEIDDLALDQRFDYPICTEYTRTDAFIEKAANWLINNTDITPTGIKNFRKAMKRD